jgi:hypothetical protein
MSMKILDPVVNMDPGTTQTFTKLATGCGYNTVIAVSIF